MKTLNVPDGKFACSVIEHNSSVETDIDDPRTPDIEDRVGGTVHNMVIECPPMEAVRDAYQTPENMMNYFPLRKGAEVLISDGGAEVSAFVILVMRSLDGNPRRIALRAVEIGG